MRDGPSVTVLSSPVSVGVRVDCSLGSRVLASDLPVISATLDSTNKRVVPTQFSAIFDPAFLPVNVDDPLNNFGQRLHVWVEITAAGIPYSVDLGWFLIVSWEETSRGIEVKANDLMQLLEDNEMVWPSSPPRGATIRTELQRLAEGIPVFLDGITDAGVPTTLQWGTSRTQAIADFCASRGFEYGIKPDGYLHVWLPRKTRDLQAVYTVDDLLFDALRKGQKRTPNVFVVAGKIEVTEDGKQVSRDYASIQSTSEYPLSPSIYGRVVDREELSGAVTRREIDDRALQKIQQRYLSVQERSVQIAVDPRLEVGDVIGILPARDPGGQEYVVGRVIAVSMPLTASGVMRVDLEVLQW